MTCRNGPLNPTLEKLSAAWAIAGGMLVILIMLVTSVNVAAFGLDRVARLFGSNVGALPGYEDYVRLAISCSTLMFFPYCQLRRGHVVVDLFASGFPDRLKSWLDRFWLAAALVLALFLAYWMTVGMHETRADNALSPVLGWPEWPFYFPGILSLVLWAAVLLSQLVQGVEGD